jgi:hypothetical protein
VLSYIWLGRLLSPKILRLGQDGLFDHLDGIITLAAAASF